jgi:prolyl 4-hydroxylase
MLKLSPEVLAAGGVDVAKEPPQARESLAGFLRSNFVPVNLSYPGLRMQNIDPPVITVDNFLTAEQCDALVAAARGSNRMAKSAVGGVTDDKDIRTSSTLAITRDVLQACPEVDAALQVLLTNASTLMQLGPEDFSLSNVMFTKPTKPGEITCELPQIAHYTQGRPRRLCSAQ